jgi:hypothetical protein
MIHASPGGSEANRRLGDLGTVALLFAFQAEALLWSAAMKVSEGDAYDHETIMLLRTALDATWEALPPEHRARTVKSDLAAQMLHLAAQGERDPDRLRIRTLMSAVAPG